MSIVLLLQMMGEWVRWGVVDLVGCLWLLLFCFCVSFVFLVVVFSWFFNDCFVFGCRCWFTVLFLFYCLSELLFVWFLSMSVF